MDKLFENTVKTISEIIKFDSSQKPPEEGAPFGRETADCLKYFLRLAESFGFETKNYDNYVGEVIFGEGEEFAVLAHLDVVPAGSGWLHDPFGGEIDTENARIWGRGAMDDKGPAVVALYCMKELKDEGFSPRKKIKLIVGCNEENGWECIEHYKKHAHMPDTGFSPDAEFPVIYAEKGILQVELAFPVKANFKNLCGGERPNMVCDFCTVETEAVKEKLEKHKLTYEGGKIISRGKAAHGSTPELGENAISPVLAYLGLDDIKEKLFGDNGLKSFKDETGRLTFSPNMIKQAGDKIFITCDIRYPAGYSREIILSELKTLYPDISVLHEQAPLYNPADCELIKTLSKVYNEVTGKDGTPIAIGGGTYARALKCGAGFGPEEPGEENTIHKANEYITFEKIRKLLKIYKLAIKRLTQNP